MTKITIIGAGFVGSTIAYTLAYSGLAQEIVLIDINENKALGEALDIRQGTPFCEPCYIHAGSYSDAKDSDIVLITSGVARKPGQSRLDLAQVNVNILKSITPEIVRYAPNATYVIISNPVDILTYAFCKFSGLPESKVIGSGTILDTSRLRSRLSDYYHINQQNVHAFVFGEHGDSSTFAWSLANISNIPVLEYPKTIVNHDQSIKELDIKEVEEYVRHSGAYIIERKGATYFAVTIAVCHICKSLLGSVNTALTLSTMLHGEYGIDDVCMSILCNVSNNQVGSKLVVPLNDIEIEGLRRSAARLKETINATKF